MKVVFLEILSFPICWFETVQKRGYNTWLNEPSTCYEVPST